MLSLPIVKREEEQTKAQAADLIESFGLSAYGSVLAGTLSTGQQRLLEITRAVAGKPKLLMLDEPAAGLNTAETEIFVRSFATAERTGFGNIGYRTQYEVHDASRTLYLCTEFREIDCTREPVRGRDER